MNKTMNPDRAMAPQMSSTEDLLGCPRCQHTQVVIRQNATVQYTEFHYNERNQFITIKESVSRTELDHNNPEYEFECLWCQNTWHIGYEIDLIWQ